MTPQTSLIPLSLRANQTFQADLSAFARESFDVLGALAKAASPTDGVITSDSIVEIATRFDRKPPELLRVALTLTYLRSRAIHESVSPDDALTEIREVLPPDVELKADENDLRSLFAATAEMTREALAVRAMAAVAPYVGSSVVPCLLPVSADNDKLLGGFLLSVRYMNSEDEQKSLALTLSPAELIKLKNQLQSAERQLERIEASQPDQTGVEG